MFKLIYLSMLICTEFKRIFHEFTHIMQSVKGQDIFAPTDVDYLERDYEIEAFEMQEKLLVDFNSKYATIIV